MSNTHDDSHHEPPPVAQVRCGCGFWGEARVTMTAPGCRGSIAGPPEPARFAASCPSCGHSIDLNHDEEPPPNEAAK